MYKHNIDIFVALLEKYTQDVFYNEYSKFRTKWGGFNKIEKSINQRTSFTIYGTKRSWKTSFYPAEYELLEIFIEFEPKENCSILDANIVNAYILAQGYPLNIQYIVSRLKKYLKDMSINITYINDKPHPLN